MARPDPEPRSAGTGAGRGAEPKDPATLSVPQTPPAWGWSGGPGDQPTDPGPDFRASRLPERGPREWPVPGWDRYRPEAFLGEGGMGSVFRAHDTTLDRPVAIKFLRSDQARAEAQFLLEARAQARLEHPNICQVFEVGEVQGRPFIAMQLVEGPPLTQFIDRLSLEQKAKLMAEVAEAVHAAHRLGLIHRDLKPANILVEAEEDGGWHPFVLDFGLARETTAAGRAASQGFQGTPAYMSPEQAGGCVLDRRSDVYSLGATLYELFVGVPPYRGGPASELAARVLKETPRPVLDLNPQLPGDLAAITERCLERDPVRRYDSARAVAEELHRFLDGEPVLARGADPVYRFRKWVSRNRLLATVAAVAVVACLGLAAMGLAAFYRASTQTRLAQAFQREVGRMEAILRGARSMPPHPLTAEQDRVRERMHEIRRTMAQEGDPAAGPGGFALGRGHLLLGDPEAALEDLQNAWDRGFRPPELAAALGEALLRIYQQKLAEFGTVRSDTRLFEPYSFREMPPAAQQRLQSDYREPARKFLALGGSSLTSEQRLYFEGLTALHEGSPAIALDRANAMARLAPWDAASHLLRAEARRTQAAVALREGSLERARSELLLAREAVQQARDLARSDPGVYEAETLCRYTSLQERMLSGQAGPKDLAWALEATRQHLQVDPGSWGARTHQAAIHMLWADARLAAGDDPRQALEEAAAAAEEARKVKPDFLWALNAEAASLIARADLGRRFFGEDCRTLALRARRAYERMLSRTAFEDQVQINLGQCDAVVGMTEAALGLDGSAQLQRSVDCYEAAERINPSATVAFLAGTPHKYLGLLAQWRGRDPVPHFSDAIAAYQRAVQRSPGHAVAVGRLADVLVLRAEALLVAGKDPLADVEAAVEASRRCIAIAPGLYLGHVNLGEALLVKARWQTTHGADPGPSLEAAKRGFETARRTHPTDPEIHRDFALHARERLRWAVRRGAPVDGLLEEAREHVRATLARNPNHGYVHIVQGEALLLAAKAGGASAARRREEAARSFTRAVQLNGNLRALAERAAGEADI